MAALLCPASPVELPDVVLERRRRWKSFRDAPMPGSWCWLRRRDGQVRMALWSGTAWRVADVLGRCTWKTDASIERSFDRWRAAL